MPDPEKLNSKPLTIKKLMVATLLAAVVFAVPLLVLRLVVLCCSLLFVFYVPLVLAAALFSESKNQQLDVENNKLFVLLGKFHMWNVAFLVISVIAIYVRSFLESSVKEYFSG